MAVYEYRCKGCENIFEEEHPIDEREIPLQKPCEKCGGELYIGLGACGLKFGGCPHKKPEGWFNDRLKEIKKKTPGNKINIIE